jgi:hypothetical protein
MPVQFPVKYELVVNLKTAKAMGLTFSESFLLRADQVIECEDQQHDRRGAGHQGDALDFEPDDTI